MRILRVAPWIYPDAKGGGGYHVHAMSRDQAAMGHDVTVLTTRSDPSLPRVEETHGYTVYRVSPGVELLGNEISPGMARFLWHVDADDYDVIHAHSHYYFSTNLAALVLLGGVTNVPRVKSSSRHHRGTGEHRRDHRCERGALLGPHGQRRRAGVAVLRVGRPG